MAEDADPGQQLVTLPLDVLRRLPEALDPHPDPDPDPPADDDPDRPPQPGGG
jgi:hypothetical protein